MWAFLLGFSLLLFEFQASDLHSAENDQQNLDARFMHHVRVKLMSSRCLLVTFMMILKMPGCSQPPPLSPPHRRHKTSDGSLRSLAASCLKRGKVLQLS